MPEDLHALIKSESSSDTLDIHKPALLHPRTHSTSRLGSHRICTHRQTDRHVCNLCVYPGIDWSKQVCTQLVCMYRVMDGKERRIGTPVGDHCTPS